MHSLERKKRRLRSNFFAVVLRLIDQFSREMIFLILQLDLSSYFLFSYSLNLAFTDINEVKLA